MATKNLAVNSKVLTHVNVKLAPNPRVQNGAIVHLRLAPDFIQHHRESF